MALTRKSAARRGASLIEFGLCALLFFMLLFGVMDWAWVFYQHQTIASRAAMAARWAAAHNYNDAAVYQLVRCGTIGCSGTTSFYADATVRVELVQVADAVDDITTLRRPAVLVRVSGYRIRHFIPGFSRTGTARDIVAMQPMECLDTAGQCACPGPNCVY